ncbi:PspC domain-containing protein [Nocardia sp. 2]|uniref:PspC domain-containing protein n=1 Tax=Nocardia acididurans TaxID=2802282 RepID=A0ABS1M4G4_9NOCA|nr:PspC domain-containing protein [Nocardia acididurans]MBL1075079.1 PspC domain-containing protein [Nocardia acididurans]
MTSGSDWSSSARTGGSFSDQVHDLWATRPVRLPQHGPVAGVAAGFGRRYNVDPVLVRVAFVVSALFGGAGIVLYLMGWLLLPQSGDQTSAAESLFGKGQASQSSSKTVVLLVALGIAVSTIGPVGAGLGGSGLISFVLMLAGWWLLHQRQPQPPVGYLDWISTDPALDPGYPGTNSPWWTGYPGTTTPGGTAPFETYGPYTKLPDHYEPDPNRQQQSQSQSGSGESAVQAQVQATETAALPEVEADTVVLRKPETPEAASDADRPVPADEEIIDAETVVLQKDTATPADDEPEHDTPAATLEKRPDDGTPPVLHRIPSAMEQPRTSYGPAPISPDFGPTPPGWDPLGVAPLAWDLPDPTATAQLPVQTQTVAPRKPRSRFTPVVIGLALLAAASAGSVAASGVEWMTPGRIAAAALAVVGIGLIMGAFLRRGYGLMVILAPLAGFVILASMIGPIEWDETTMGDQSWAATSAADLRPAYKVNMGSATLDLSALQLTEDRTTTVTVGAGEAKVILPENLRVNTTCNVRMGDASNCKSGLSGPAEGPILNLIVNVRMGDVEVTRG